LGSHKPLAALINPPLLSQRAQGVCFLPETLMEGCCGLRTSSFGTQELCQGIATPGTPAHVPVSSLVLVLREDSFPELGHCVTPYLLTFILHPTSIGFFLFLQPSYSSVPRPTLYPLPSPSLFSIRSSFEGMGKQGSRYRSEHLPGCLGTGNPKERTGATVHHPEYSHQARGVFLPR
jgi:hypothetical protein